MMSCHDAPSSTDKKKKKKQATTQVRVAHLAMIRGDDSPIFSQVHHALLEHLLDDCRLSKPLGSLTELIRRAFQLVALEIYHFSKEIPRRLVTCPCLYRAGENQRWPASEARVCGHRREQNWKAAVYSIDSSFDDPLRSAPESIPE